MVRCHTPEEGREDRRPLLVNAHGSDVRARRSRDDELSYDSVQDDGSRLVDIPKEPPSVEWLPYILLNVIFTLVSSADRFWYLDQYLYKYYAGPYAGNNTNTGSDPCFHPINKTSPEVEIQRQASELLLYLDLSKSILGTFSCMALGALTVVLSRRTLILIPLVGHLTRCAVIGGVVFFDLHVHWLFIGFTADGLMGGTNCFTFALMVYLSEITSRNKSRTFLIAVLESLKGALTASLDIAKGNLIQYSGYTTPAVVSTACILVAVIITMFLPARQPTFHTTEAEKEDRTPLMRRFWTKLKVPFTSASPGASTIITLAGLTYFFGILGGVVYLQSWTLYVINQPFCWSSSHFGWFEALDSFSDYVFNIIVIGLFTKYLPGGVALGIPAIIIAGAGKVLYGAATTNTEVYIAAVLGLAGSVASVLVRGETSRVLGPEAQGPWFAVIAVVESACFVLGTPAIALYRWSLDIKLTGLVFYIAAFFFLLKGLTLVVYQVKWQKYAALQSLLDEASPDKEASSEKGASLDEGASFDERASPYKRAFPDKRSSSD